MAEFDVPVVRIDEVTKHPNADLLMVNRFRGFLTISNLRDDGTPRFNSGDLAIYVPENALVPESILREHGFWDDAKGKGLLGGKLGNRVKPKMLRGILSQGLMLPWTILGMADGPPPEGLDVSMQLGIEKYVPVIPASMGGEVFNANMPVNFDVENIQRYPDAFQPDDEVVVTEKIHGTCCIVGYNPTGDSPDAVYGKFYVGSKGLAKEGLFFRATNDNMARNLYLRTLAKQDADGLNVFERISAYCDVAHPGKFVWVFGEVYGERVQDLTYGVKGQTFSMFDAIVEGQFVPAGQLAKMAWASGIPAAPVVSMGQWSMIAPSLGDLNSGQTMVKGGTNIREGVVIRPMHQERQVYSLGRLILKSVSPAYLLRQNGTEFA